MARTAGCGGDGLRRVREASLRPTNLRPAAGPNAAFAPAVPPPHLHAASAKRATEAADEELAAAIAMSLG